MSATTSDKQNESFTKVKNEWFRKVISRDDTSQLFDSLEVIKNVVDTTKVKLSTPENTSSFDIVNKTSGQTVYVGDGTTDGYPLTYNESIKLENMMKDNNNEIYAIATAASNVYVVGVYKQ